MASTGARPLSEADIAAFKRDGFLIVPGLFSTAEVDDVARWSDEIRGWPEAPGRHMMYYENSLAKAGERILSRIENFCPFHSRLDQLIRDNRLLGAVAQLLGESAVLFKDKINMKRPGGGGFEAHQDAQAGWNAYARYYITALVGIDATTPENGCLELVRGCHENGLIGEEWTPLSEAGTTGLTFEPVATEPGDVIFFDSYAPHRSAPNLTDRQRRVLYITYNRRSEGDHRARYYADKRKNYPPDIERDPDKNYVFRV